MIRARPVLMINKTEPSTGQHNTENRNKVNQNSQNKKSENNQQKSNQKAVEIEITNSLLDDLV